MCEKCQNDCESCQILVKKYGDSLPTCEFCGHLYAGETCTCTRGDPCKSCPDVDGWCLENDISPPECPKKQRRD